MLTLVPPGNSDLGWCHIPGARLACDRRLESPGPRELGVCGRQCTSKMDLEYLFLSAEPPTSRYRQEKLRAWS